jgi:hypothetical protein
MVASEALMFRENYCRSITISQLVIFPTRVDEAQEARITKEVLHCFSKSISLSGPISARLFPLGVRPRERLFLKSSAEWPR